MSLNAFHAQFAGPPAAVDEVLVFEDGDYRDTERAYGDAIAALEGAAQHPFDRHAFITVDRPPASPGPWSRIRTAEAVDRAKSVAEAQAKADAEEQAQKAAELEAYRSQRKQRESERVARRAQLELDQAARLK